MAALSISTPLSLLAVHLAPTPAFILKSDRFGGARDRINATASASLISTLYPPSSASDRILRASSFVQNLQKDLHLKKQSSIFHKIRKNRYGTMTWSYLLLRALNCLIFSPPASLKTRRPQRLRVYNFFSLRGRKEINSIPSGYLKSLKSQLTGDNWSGASGAFHWPVLASRLRGLSPENEKSQCTQRLASCRRQRVGSSFTWIANNIVPLILA